MQRRDIRQLIEATGDSLDYSYLRKWIADLGLEGAWAKLHKGTDR